VTLLGANVSPLENELHGSATFLIGTVDRALSHQMVRHRLGSFSQVSQRYVGVDKADWGFIKPDSIRGDAEKALNAHWEIIKAFYKGLRDEFDVLKEDARCVLPNMCETRFVVTMPMYGWKHFLKLRLDKAAQLPIRRVAQAVDYALLTLR
jgi:thymidylate synthase (FAD)